MKKLPETIFGLMDLSTLTLGGSQDFKFTNSLCNLPPILKNISGLTALFAPNIGLTSIPEEIGHLKVNYSMILYYSNS